MFHAIDQCTLDLLSIRSNFSRSRVRRINRIQVHNSDFKIHAFKYYSLTIIKNLRKKKEKMKNLVNSARLNDYNIYIAQTIASNYSVIT